jgi:hypothetical protein
MLQLVLVALQLAGTRAPLRSGPRAWRLRLFACAADNRVRVGRERAAQVGCGLLSCSAARIAKFSGAVRFEGFTFSQGQGQGHWRACRPEERTVGRRPRTLQPSCTPVVTDAKRPSTTLALMGRLLQGGGYSHTTYEFSIRRFRGVARSRASRAWLNAVDGDARWWRKGCAGPKPNPEDAEITNFHDGT